MIKKWEEYLENKGNLIEFIIVLLALVLTLFALSNFLNGIENRQGTILNDPVLNMIHPIELTWVIFGVLYFGIVLGVINLIKYPDILISGIKAYITLIIIRMLVMWLLPLEPPESMIILKDPIVEFFTDTKPFTKDLFFSGHTATMFLFFLIVRGRFYKSLFGIGTLIVALSVILQHVHYTIDVIAAPAFTYCAYKISNIFKCR